MKRIIKGDKVRIISGKFKSKEGIVLSVNNANNNAIVEGVNKIKRHEKPSQKNNNKGGIIEKEAPISLSKLALVVDKSPNGISKIAYKINDKGIKIRISKKTKAELKGSAKK
jgi:large subunit ribosomal protein L24